MRIAHEAKAGIGHAMKSVHAGVEKIASRKLCGGRPPTLDIRSSVFVPGGPLPRSTSVDGDSVPPPLAWTSVPPGTKSLVLLCEDPDAPIPQPFVHWMVYGIPASARAISSASAKGWLVGLNSKLKSGFVGVAPPTGHGLHRYHFQLFALDVDLRLAPSSGRTALLDAMKDHVLAYGDCVGTYERT
jgi:Raf kinase inhibitor-like YbhB/YbcL family protein